jgi:Family of unknown function (DUF6444)
MRVAEACRLIAELTAQAGRLAAQVERLSARIGELERQARTDSSTSSRPPSSDSPYRKKGGDRSLREQGGGISKLDALRSLFNGSTWLPPGLEPAG